MRQRGLLGPPADLDEPLVGRDQPEGRRPRARQDPLEVRIRGIAAGDPDDLRRRAMEPHQIDEVSILRQYDGASTARGEEDLRVHSIAQSQILERCCLDAQLLTKPERKLGRELGVNPDLHAARIG